MPPSTLTRGVIHVQRLRKYAALMKARCQGCRTGKDETRLHKNGCAQKQVIKDVQRVANGRIKAKAIERIMRSIAFKLPIYKSYRGEFLSYAEEGLIEEEALCRQTFECLDMSYQNFLKSYY